MKLQETFNGFAVKNMDNKEILKIEYNKTNRNIMLHMMDEDVIYLCDVNKFTQLLQKMLQRIEKDISI